MDPKSQAKGKLGCDGSCMQEIAGRDLLFALITYAGVPLLLVALFCNGRIKRLHLQGKRFSFLTVDCVAVALVLGAFLFLAVKLFAGEEFAEGWIYSTTMSICMFLFQVAAMVWAISISVENFGLNEGSGRRAFRILVFGLFGASVAIVYLAVSTCVYLVFFFDGAK